MKPAFNKVIIARYIFVFVAILIAVGSLFISNILVSDLAKEEKIKMDLWTQATKAVIEAESDSKDLDLILHIISSNKSIPVILFDEKNNFYSSANIDLPHQDEQDFLKKQAERFERKHEPILVHIEDYNQLVYYDNSYLLKKLQYFPYIQLAAMAVFVFSVILFMLSARKREQDRLWVALTKETAHQLGTPLSSLMAWLEVLKIECPESSVTDDMRKDIERLYVITDRFSKIGSKPSFEYLDVVKITRNILEYLSHRLSKKIDFYYDFPDYEVKVYMSETLFSWVIENLTKNAIDAMKGEGKLFFKLFEFENTVTLDITDQGKGIPKSKFKDIFKPGFSTKTRGWGLGLSLAKRVIEEYQGGKIFVLKSEAFSETTIRMEFPKVNNHKINISGLDDDK